MIVPLPTIPAVAPAAKLVTVTTEVARSAFTDVAPTKLAALSEIASAAVVITARTLTVSIPETSAVSAAPPVPLAPLTVMFKTSLVPLVSTNESLMLNVPVLAFGVTIVAV